MQHVELVAVNIKIANLPHKLLLKRVKLFQGLHCGYV